MTSRSLINRLTKEIEGEFLSDNFSRGRYSTDASIYQLMPVGVVVPKSINDVEATIKIAREEGLPVLPRGSGTSQNGQAIGEALLIDTTRHLNQVIDFNAEKNTVCVEPGLVLDQLNRFLKPHGLFYPVDVSTANRATLGGMTGNNSCGARSIRYGNMVHNVLSIEALLADGSKAHFKKIGEGSENVSEALSTQLLNLGKRESKEIDERFPKLLRRVGGYNIDELTKRSPNLGRLLVGSRVHWDSFRKFIYNSNRFLKKRSLGCVIFPHFMRRWRAHSTLSS